MLTHKNACTWLFLLFLLSSCETGISISYSKIYRRTCIRIVYKRNIMKTNLFNIKQVISFNITEALQSATLQHQIDLNCWCIHITRFAPSSGIILRVRTFEYCNIQTTSFFFTFTFFQQSVRGWTHYKTRNLWIFFGIPKTLKTNYNNKRI